MISRLITPQCNFSIFPGARGPRDLVCLHINARSMIWGTYFWCENTRCQSWLLCFLYNIHRKVLRVYDSKDTLFICRYLKRNTLWWHHPKNLDLTNKVHFKTLRVGTGKKNSPSLPEKASLEPATAKVNSSFQRSIPVGPAITQKKQKMKPTQSRPWSLNAV